MNDFYGEEILKRLDVLNLRLESLTKIMIFMKNYDSRGRAYENIMELQNDTANKIDEIMTEKE